MKEPTITIEHLLQELQQRHDVSGGGATFEELVEATGMPPNKLRRLLKQNILAGTIEVYQETRNCVMRPGWRYAANCFRVKR